MTAILLARHGENDFAGKGLAGRLPDIHLNDKGRQQAELLAERLGKFPIKAIFSSPLERAIETAQPLAKRLGLDIQIRQTLVEVDYGEIQGKEFKQLQRTKLWKEIQTHPAVVRFPGGESLLEVQQRVCDDLVTLAGQFRANDVIACFTHADVIRLSAAWALNMNLDDFQRLAVGMGSVTVIQVEEKRARVLHLNQVMDFNWIEPAGKKKTKRPKTSS